MKYLVCDIAPGPTGTKRQRERAAVTDLLTRLTGQTPVIGHDTDGAPRLLNLPGLHVSISHSRLRAAVAVSDSGPVGIDIEEPSGRLGGIIGRVTAPGDDTSLSPLTRWCVKEAVFKAAGIAGLVISEISVSADMTATARERRFAWTSPSPGLVIAKPL